MPGLLHALYAETPDLRLVVHVGVGLKDVVRVEQRARNSAYLRADICGRTPERGLVGRRRRRGPCSTTSWLLNFAFSANVHTVLR